jgi:transposase
MNVESKILDFYGIVSGISKKINLVATINELTKSDPQRKVSVGDCALALILNATGLTMSKPLYLTHQFFKTKPIEKLIGNIDIEDLNDDSLGRALDIIYETGPNKIFSHVALKAADIFKIDTSTQNVDITNIQVHGSYENQDEEEQLITFGYAKQGRRDLKQFMLSMITSQDGAIPLYFQALAGNESDSIHFKDVIKMFEEQLKENPRTFYAIFDCKMYTADNLKEIDKALFITRVPETIDEAKAAKEKFVNLEGMEKYNENYKIAEITSEYGGVKQRWAVVYSKEAHERSKKAIDAKTKKEKIKFEKDLKQLKKQDFSCEKDAKKAVFKLSKSYKFHTIKLISITESKSKKESIFNINEIQILEKEEDNKKQAILDGIFVLSTNQMSKKQLTTNQILENYKSQSTLENRFNVFKNASCFASKIYLKNEKRIVALAMIMCLTLLIYSLAENEVRKALEVNKDTIPNQAGKPINNPTMKWIFKMFEGVTFVTIKTGDQIIEHITNLSNTLKKILGYLGSECMEIYSLISDSKSNLSKI